MCRLVAGEPMAASAPARLITIPISHYCEKARWAWTRRVSPTARSVMSSSSTGSRRAGPAAGRTVPVLVRAEGVLAQSAEILA